MKAPAKEKKPLSGRDIGRYRKEYTPGRFWAKLSALPRDAGRALVEKAVTLYVMAMSPDLPAPARLAVLATLGYFLCPWDLVFDGLPGLGLADDLALMALLAVELEPFLTPAMRERVQSLMPAGMRRTTATKEKKK